MIWASRMAIEGKNGQLTPFGRISLDRVYDEWESSHHLNPRFLAGEMAATLDTLYQFDQTIQPLHACVFSGGKPDRSAVIEYSALIAHFQAASQGQKLTTIGSSVGPVPTTHVLLWRSWIDRISQEASALAEMAVGCAMPANDSGSVSATANSSPKFSPSLPPSGISGNSPLVLKARQAQLRRSAEKTAAEVVDDLRVQIAQLEERLSKADSALVVERSWRQEAEQNAELNRREINSEKRARIAAEDEQIRMEALLEPQMLTIEFLNPDNPLSPPEIREMFQCWLSLTKNNEREPVKASSKGMEALCRDWFKAQGVTAADKRLARFATTLTSSSRKKGGAVARD